MKIKKTLLIAASVLALVGLPAARAQDQKQPATPTTTPPPKPENSGEVSTAENTATTRFIEAFQTQDWEKTEKAYKELVDNFPLYRKDTLFVYRYAVTLYNLKSQTKKDEAKAQLQGLLENDPGHILALYLLAQIEAEQYKADRPQPLEEAKDHLLEAAKNGFYTLRELSGSKLPQFKELRDDPKFILRVMRAPTSIPPITIKNNVRNPFQVPRVNAQGKPTDAFAISARDIALLEGRIDGLFSDIKKLINDKEIDKLAPLFQELNQIMSEYKKIGIEKVAANLKKWEKQLDEWKEVKLAVQLQIYINKGNECLRAMLKANKAEKFDETFEQFGEVKQLVEQMRHEEREEFHRNADAIFIRAKKLDEEAHKLKKIKEFNLVVTGIVVDPRPESKNRAIIIFDDPGTGQARLGRIYEENDDIRDKEERKVPGLKVVKISEGSIKFKYEDTEFIRELKQSDAK